MTPVMTGALASPNEEADELRAAAQPELEEGETGPYSRAGERRLLRDAKCRVRFRRRYRTPP